MPRVDTRPVDRRCPCCTLGTRPTVRRLARCHLSDLHDAVRVAPRDHLPATGHAMTLHLDLDDETMRLLDQQARQAGIRETRAYAERVPRDCARQPRPTTAAGAAKTATSGLTPGTDRRDEPGRGRRAAPPLPQGPTPRRQRHRPRPDQRMPTVTMGRSRDRLDEHEAAV